MENGHLKIFFGYAVGAGKTWAMLNAALECRRRGMDVIVGCVDTGKDPQLQALADSLERLPARVWTGHVLAEFDLDGVLARKPDLVLIDDLAHVNGSGCRHTRRYREVEELLNAGIDVYTTVNVQQLESLHDMVTAITGAEVSARIPDSFFDNADQVELVDIEPRELMARLARSDAPGGSGNITIDMLTALREIALRRCADRVNRLIEKDGSHDRATFHTDEHVLVCLSSAPSNAKIIRMAARMAGAYRSAFTALFVETPDFASNMKEEDRRRLEENRKLASQLGAKIETVYGDDVPFQIAEFARVSGVSQIVIGRSGAWRRTVFARPSLTDRLIASAPNLDIHIIPDSSGENSYRRMRSFLHPGVFAASLSDMAICTAVLVLASMIGYLFYRWGFTEANIIMVYILGVLIISVTTTYRVYSLLSSIISVLVFNFFFTVPKFTLLAYDKGYPVTFLVMFLAASITGSLAAKLKMHARQSAQSAYRTKILLDTNQLLQQASGRQGIMEITGRQIVKLLDRKAMICLAEKDGSVLSSPRFFDGSGEITGQTVMPEEQAVAEWVLKNNKHAGATTDTFSESRFLYLAVRVNNSVYGVVGIEVGAQSLDAFEYSVLLSILGEGALALENEKNAREKEEAAILAKNEQLRANLLRAISHDLRTPLTSISGNASNLMSNGDRFDADTRQQIYTDIYDDSMWLINLVENLLAITRFEQGRVTLNQSTELMEEVIAEALHHVNRRSEEHTIRVSSGEELVLARMDARLIVQVLINLVDNAVKYTPAGSTITIDVKKIQQKVFVTISDDGPGVSDEAKPHIFDMFYCGANRIADSRRSLGLGLALCRSIIAGHGGEITVSDNEPHGAVFTFTLPAGEVKLNEQTADFSS